MIIWFVKIVLTNLVHFDSGITPPYLPATLTRNINGTNLPPLPGDVESLICPLSPLASQEFCQLCYTRSDLLNVQMSNRILGEPNLRQKVREIF